MTRASPTTRRSTVTEALPGYAVAVLAVGLATAARAALDPALGDALPFATFYPAVAASVAYGGLRPGLVALVLGYLAADWFFMPPRHARVVVEWTPSSTVAALTYLFAASTMTAFCHAMQVARRGAEAATAALDDFFENAAIGLHWIGPDGTILRANRTELEMLGYARDEYVGRHVAAFHVDRDVIDDVLVRVAHGETLRERPARLRCTRQVEQLARLVDDLLDVARVTRGKIELRREPVFVAAIMERAVEACRPQVEERGHALSVSTGDAALEVLADPARLEQIVVNLLTNAVRYTPSGGRIELEATRVGTNAVLRVRDDGTGIAPELLPTIFDPFVQAEQSLERTAGGLGLGLAVVKRLVDLHGGRIEARSNGPGKGSEFVVTLPATLAREAAAPAAALPVAGGRRARILIVEDNVDAAESLGMLLQLLGHEIVVTHAGADALDAIRRAVPDVALIDIRLPGMDGYELASKIRALRDGNAIILVALTGYGRAKDKTAAHEAGFDHHVTKPVDLDALQGLLVTAGRTVRPRGDGEALH